jgi:hypothetical protein
VGEAVAEADGVVVAAAAEPVGVAPAEAVLPGVEPPGVHAARARYAGTRAFL